MNPNLGSLFLADSLNNNVFANFESMNFQLANTLKQQRAFQYRLLAKRIKQTTIMAILLIFLASFLSLSKSKYFPKEWQEAFAITRQRPMLTRLLSYLLLAVAAYLFVQELGGFTGIVVWSVIVMLAFSIVVMLVPFLNWLDGRKVGSRK